MWPFKTTPRIEHPERLREFLLTLEGSDWRNGSTAAIDHTFTALNELIYHEALFYYRARKKQRLFSVITRGLAILLGTLGIMVPLLSAADPALFKPVAPYGYPLLAASGAVLLINRMFGATGGHIRYVTAQLELERILTKFRLAWFEWKARESIASEPGATHPEAFQLMNHFVDESYRVIQEETNAWGKSVSEALRDYENRFPAAQENGR